MADFEGTPASASPYADQAGSDKANSVESGGLMKRARISYTHELGAGTGEINLTTLPAGQVIIYDNSKMITSSFGTSATMDVGYRFHIDEVGAEVDADPVAFVEDFDAETGGEVDFSAKLVDGYMELNSKFGITMFATVADGDIEDDDTIMGYISFARM
jgi:hypothetical protein